MFNQKKSKLMQTKGQLMKSLNTAFSFAPPSILSLTILMFLLYHNDTIMKNEKIVHGLYAKNNKKVYLERQLAYAIMAVAKKEIIKSKQHTPFLLPDWVRQRSYYIIYSNFLGRRRIKYKRLMPLFCLTYTSSQYSPLLSTYVPYQRQV